MANKTLKPLTSVIGAAFLASAVVPMANAATADPFAAQELNTGYNLASFGKQLESLYDQLTAQLSTAKPGSNAAVAMQSQLATVGGELAQRGAAGVRTQLSEVGRIDGHPMGLGRCLSIRETT